MTPTKGWHSLLAGILTLQHRCFQQMHTWRGTGAPFSVRAHAQTSCLLMCGGANEHWEAAEGHDEGKGVTLETRRGGGGGWKVTFMAWWRADTSSPGSSGWLQKSGPSRANAHVRVLSQHFEPASLSVGPSGACSGPARSQISLSPWLRAE